VAGGYGNPRGDIPIYITNIHADGCIGRSKQVKVRSNINTMITLQLKFNEEYQFLFFMENT
jgi:hypothetical protein